MKRNLRSRGKEERASREKNREKKMKIEENAEQAIINSI